MSTGTSKRSLAEEILCDRRSFRGQDLFTVAGRRHRSIVVDVDGMLNYASSSPLFFLMIVVNCGGAGCQFFFASLGCERERFDHRVCHLQVELAITQPKVLSCLPPSSNLETAGKAWRVGSV